MPSWSAHLEAGKRVADQLSIKGKNRQEFLLGCILPDINNGYANHPHIIKSHVETHYVGSHPNLDIRNYICLGYLFHLYLDNCFNDNYNSRIKQSPFKDKSEREIEDIKHNDFWLYGTKFYHPLDLSQEYLPTLAADASRIDVVDVTPDDILEVTDIIKSNRLNDHLRGGHYIFYSQEELECLLNDACESFIKQYSERVKCQSSQK